MKERKFRNLNHNTFMHIRNNSKGITLVALLVTIIVLVILSGVTIATLYGDSGVLSEANNAKTKYENSTAEEAVRIAVVDSFGKDGEIDINQLNHNLSNLGIDANIESLPTGNINYQGSLFIIKKDGSVSAFNAEEWDKTAADEDCFIWKSNVEGEDGYGTIIGYNKNIDNYTKLRYPSRCTKIEFSGSLNYPEVDTARSRGFTNNILKVELPQTVTSIGSFAFGDYGNTCFQAMETIEIPDSVTTIADHAFIACVALNNIKLPESIKTIENSTFEGCTNLKNITMMNNITVIKEAAFRDCINLEKIKISDNVTAIGKEAFHGTAWFNNQSDGIVYLGKVLYTYKGTMPTGTVIDIKKGTKGIADSAFRRCTNLVSVTIPPSLINIGNNAFFACTNLNYIIIPKSVVNIGAFAFSNCNKIKSIIIPNSVTNIQQCAFANWDAYQTILCAHASEPEGWNDIWDNYYYSIERKCVVRWGYTFAAEEWDKTAADEDCFIWASNVGGTEGYNTIIGYTEKVNNYTKLRYPTRCTKIEFSATLNEQEHGVLNSVTSRAFTNNILKVELPDTVITIGNSAFGADSHPGFQSMETIILPESLTSIGQYAFSKCINLTNIIIPSSVTIISDYAFWGWEENQTIYCEVSSKPSSWATTWDYYSKTETTRKAQLVWGYTGE